MTTNRSLTKPWTQFTAFSFKNLMPLSTIYQYATPLKQPVLAKTVIISVVSGQLSISLPLSVRLVPSTLHKLFRGLLIIFKNTPRTFVRFKIPGRFKANVVFKAGARVALVVCVAPCLFQHGRQRRSSSVRVYKFSLLCSGFASISGTTSGKSKVDMSTPVHAVATPLNTWRASRACRDERVAQCCPTSATQLFPVNKMHGLHSVSCDSTSGTWA